MKKKNVYENNIIKIPNYVKFQKQACDENSVPGIFFVGMMKHRIDQK